MKYSRQILLILTGGLGNQLFQVAAGLALSNGTEFLVDKSVGKPRTNSKDEPELVSFVLPKQIRFLPTRKGSWLVSKSSGYVLRMGIAKRKYENIFIIREFIIFSASLISSLYFRSIRQNISAVGIGFSKITIPKRKIVLSGYFQSYRWASNLEVKNQLMALRIRNEGNELKFYKSLSLIEKPLVIHIRLGDYKIEPDFGVLSNDYYIQAISNIPSESYNKIWLFSDEPELAQNYFDDILREKIRVIPEIDNSAASTLELMRYGHCYIIGNSTFSWWGAFLRYRGNAKIVAPKPWFKDMPEPRDLIPLDWIRILAWK